MNWYVAKIIFRIISGDGNHSPQFDEQLRLIEAGNEAEALEKANGIGITGQDDFLNAKKETVKWLFIAVTEISGLANLHNGTELYYKLYEVQDAEAYIEQMLRKAGLITHKALKGRNTSAQGRALY